LPAIHPQADSRHLWSARYQLKIDKLGIGVDIVAAVRSERNVPNVPVVCTFDQAV
jgi:hypothetical protein